MEHDFSIVFETDNPYWQRVLDIFAKNEKYEKKIVSNRNLHHKFPRSFSKLLGESVDNDKDNLISLSLADHFLVHYYYYLLAKKGFRQSMATAFTFMAKKGLKYMTPETAEAMAKDYADARAIANQAQSERMKGNDFFKGHTLSQEARMLISDNHADVSGSNHPMWGRNQSAESKLKNRQSHLGKKASAQARRKMSEAAKGRTLSDETKRKMHEAALRREARKRGEEI